MAKKDPKKILFKKSEEVNAKEISVPDYKSISFDKFINSFEGIGFQASNLGKAIKIINKMKEENATIYFGFTSNIVSSGLRDIITQIVKKNQVNAIVTTAGGIEEDIIKVHKPFFLGTFEPNDSKLRSRGINRIGNIFVPNERYIWLESFIHPLLKRLYKEGKRINSVEFCKELAVELERKKIRNRASSFIYQAYKNKIPVICPSIVDGAIGGGVFFFKQDYPDFSIDITDDKVFLDKLTLNAEKLGVIILGGGLAKHFILNSALMREGFDYGVYVSTGVKEDGSISGAYPEEALSWGKARKESNYTNVFCDATIAFPLIAKGSLLK